jgi:hypothetical protein
VERTFGDEEKVEFVVGELEAELFAFAVLRLRCEGHLAQLDRSTRL